MKTSPPLLPHVACNCAMASWSSNLHGVAVARRQMLELPCPAFHETLHPFATSLQAHRVLFLLDATDRSVAGAVQTARWLTREQAQQLWAKHPWQPAKPGQPWPEPPQHHQGDNEWDVLAADAG